MKKNCKPTSNACSSPDRTDSILPLASGFKGNTSSALLCLSALITLSTSSFSAPLPVERSTAGSGVSRIEDQIRQDLALHAKSKKTRFESTLAGWQKKHGPQALPALKKLAHDRKQTDQDRYMAMMGMTRIGGEAALSDLLPLANDKSWMIRSGVLKAIELTRSPTGTRTTEKLLKDPALVIRTQAVDTLIEINPPDLAETLVRAAYDPRNYRGGNFKKGRAEWVPQHALAGLRKLKPRGMAARLVPLMTQAHDPKLRAHALFTIEAIEGRQLHPDSPFRVRAQAWAKQLASAKAPAARANRTSSSK